MTREQLLRMVLTPGATLRDAMIAFDKTGIGVVLVCDEGMRLVGVATEGDVRRALLQGHGLIAQLDAVLNKQPRLGKTTMSRDELLQLMSERVYCLPIVDDDHVLHDVLFHESRTFIPVATPVIGEREYNYVSEAVLSGWVSSSGKYIERFEQQFAAFCGASHAVAVSNGTVALHLALVAAGIGPGDEVIVPAMTFAATANAVIYCGAKPVIVDIDRLTWNIDPIAIERAITPRTRAIIPVHIYGNPCDMEAIMSIASKRNLIVLEDAAEAHGAEYGGRRVGSIGHMGSFSFFGNKLITTGEGGAVVCNDKALDEKMRVLRDHGMNKSRRYWHDVVGFNYRMTNIQAALGVAQLERWDQILAGKERVRASYNRNLSIEGLKRPQVYPGARDVCWIYSVTVQGRPGFDRDDMMRRLREHNVDSRPLFFPLPAMPPYFVEGWREKFPVATEISYNGFSLPSSVELDDSKLEHIAKATNAVAQ